jgi:hypothetical protein
MSIGTIWDHWEPTAKHNELKSKMNMSVVASFHERVFVNTEIVSAANLKERQTLPGEGGVEFWG